MRRQYPGRGQGALEWAGKSTGGNRLFVARLFRAQGACMKQFARWSSVTALLTLLPILPAHATSSLSFEGGGYSIELEIGETERPGIAAVRFHAPGDRRGVVLPPRLIRVEAFDPGRQVLVLHYSGGESGVAAFTLSAHQQTATLQSGSQRVVSRFNWDM